MVKKYNNNNNNNNIFGIIIIYLEHYTELSMLLQSNLKKIEYLALLFLDQVSYDVKNYADLGGCYRGRSLSSAEAPAGYPNKNSNTYKK